MFQFIVEEYVNNTIPTVGKSNINYQHSDGDGTCRQSVIISLDAKRY